MTDNDSIRVDVKSDVLKDGRKVFYVEVGDLPPSEIADYLKKIAQDYKDKTGLYADPIK